MKFLHDIVSSRARHKLAIIFVFTGLLDELLTIKQERFGMLEDTDVEGR